jgi:hypothetical protein
MNSSTPPHRPLGLYAGLLVLALAGLLAQRYATTWGGGVSPDSTQYIEGARNLLRGEGISSPDGAGTSTPITLWPPLVSVLLAAPGLLGVEPAEAGRWLTGLLFGANILLMGHVLAHATRNSVIAAWTGGALMLLSPDLFEVHTWIWSEPLFILLSLAGCALLAAFLERPSACGFWAAAAFACLAGLTRFAGAALGLGGMGLILGFARISSIRRRAAAAAGFGLVSLGPLALWMLRSALIAGSATTRELGFRRLYSVHFLPGLETAAAWLFPGGAHSLLRVAVLAVFLLALLWSGARYLKAQHSARPDSNSLQLLPHSLIGFLVSYGAVLLFSKYFVDPFFPLDDRILSPALGALILLAVMLWHSELRRAAHLASSRVRPRAVRTLLAVLVLAQLGLSARQSAAWAATAHEKGLGFNSRSWQDSPLVDFVAALPPDAVIYSNADDGLLFSTGHPAWRLPAASSSDPPAWPAQVQERLGLGEAYVVYFDAITWRDLVTPGDLQRHFAVEALLQTEEGEVLQFSPNTEE